MRSLKLLVALMIGSLLILCVGTALLLGQTITGSITGMVSDQSGAAIPRVDLTATNTQTGVTYRAVGGEKEEDTGRPSRRERAQHAAVEITNLGPRRRRQRERSHQCEIPNPEACWPHDSAASSVDGLGMRIVDNLGFLVKSPQHGARPDGLSR